MGPVFFILYINGLLNINTEVEIMCFADDTIILIHDKLYIKANVVFKNTKSAWFDNNLFELNINKTKHINTLFLVQKILIFGTI